MIESVARLRETQTSLQTQMQQMQDTTQGQADNIISAIQQLQQEPSGVRVSDAGAKMESPLAETEK